MSIYTETEKVIASNLDRMHEFFPNRWRIRRSTKDESGQYCATGENGSGFTCPAQVEKVDGCASCMACAYIKKPVRFLNHGRTAKNPRSTTIYQKSIQPVDSGRKILKVGSSNKKIKSSISIGEWAGSKILTVSGIERMHCPKSCHHWNDCYGNNMPFVHRFQIHEREVMNKLREEALNLPIRKGGYAIRLHVVGDFPNVAYVQMWYDVMMNREDIKVFGFTSLPINTNVEIW